MSETARLHDLYTRGINAWSGTKCEPGDTISKAIEDLLTGHSLLESIVKNGGSLDHPGRCAFLDLYNDSIATLARCKRRRAVAEKAAKVA